MIKRVESRMNTHVAAFRGIPRNLRHGNDMLPPSPGPFFETGSRHPIRQAFHWREKSAFGSPWLLNLTLFSQLGNISTRNAPGKPAIPMALSASSVECINGSPSSRISRPYVHCYHPVRRAKSELAIMQDTNIHYDRAGKIECMFVKPVRTLAEVIDQNP